MEANIVCANALERKAPLDVAATLSVERNMEERIYYAWLREVRMNAVTKPKSARK